MRIEIRPLPNKRWHGKEGKESFKQPMTVQALYDPQTGGYATGLTPEEEKEYGEKIGADLSSKFTPDPHPFWDSKAAEIKLQNYTMILNTDNPRDFIKYKLLKASKFVANTQVEQDKGMWPDATHVIYSEEEETTIKATKVQRKQKCYALLADLDSDSKASIIQILSEKTMRGRKPNAIDVEIDRIIEENPNDFIKFAEMDKGDVYTRSAVLEAIHRGILTKEGTSVYYMGEKLASDTEDTIAYFTDVQNQKIKIAILDKLNN